ncbi:MAG TPA: sigma-70 family RNA polymerase sigma factor [Verrucomicrobiae bacterium]|nr:sigma-70 family RNA polymerase sigma factor [Verrucomicrobiae bacterium]
MDETSSQSLDPDRQKELVSLITRHQRRIFSYLYALVPDRHAAEDLLQETNLIICEKFASFRSGTDFVAWACQIAHWRVRNARQKFARSKVTFNQEVVDAIAATASSMVKELDARHEALEHCLGRLHPRDREMMLTRYEPGCGVAEAAQRSGRSLQAAYKALARIRKLLFDCVTSRLAREGAP